MVVRAILEHYTRYILPIQMADRAADLPKQLELSLRVCPEKDLSPDEAQIANLPKALWLNGEYRLRVGDRVAFHVRNTTPVNLRVTVVNCAATGCVQLLGDQVIDGHDGAHLFWLPGTVGQPFIVSVPDGAHAGTDRVVAIGRNSLNSDLEFLRVDRNFSDIVAVTRSAKNFEAQAKAVVPPELWTAHQVITRTGV